MQMNIAKAIGITAVVAGHNHWDIFGEMFPSYSFHMALFFFISGYFVNIEIKFLKFIKKILTKYFGWLYAYHFFYGAMTVLVFLLFNRLYGQMPTLKKLTLSVFDSMPFEFDGPNWFLSCLAISLIVFVIIMTGARKISKNNFFPALIFIPLAVFAMLCSKPDFEQSFGLVRVLIRTAVSMYFIYAGWLYKNELEKRTQFNIKWLCAMFIIQAVFLLVFFGNFFMDINVGKFSHSLSAMFIPFTGIYFVLFLSKILEPLVHTGSIIDTIGRNSLHIMANHLFIIFIIEVLIFLIDGRSMTELPDAPILCGNFYNTAKYKILYTIASLILCTYIGKAISIVTAKRTIPVSKFQE